MQGREEEVGGGGMTGAHDEPTCRRLEANGRRRQKGLCPVRSAPKVPMLCCSPHPITLSTLGGSLISSTPTCLSVFVCVCLCQFMLLV